MYMYFNMYFDLHKVEKYMKFLIKEFFQFITINYQLGGSMQKFFNDWLWNLRDSQQFCKLAISNDSNTSIHNFNLQSIELFIMKQEDSSFI